jgi:hypothetical protein
MSQEMRNRKDEGHDNMSQPVHNNQGGSSGGNDGFEGMNYEQRRGPYNPARNGEPSRDDHSKNKSGKRRDDL